MYYFYKGLVQLLQRLCTTSTKALYNFYKRFVIFVWLVYWIPNNNDWLLNCGYYVYN